MFTDQDLQSAIEAGIFDKYNNITATNPAQIIRFFEAWVKQKTRDVRVHPEFFVFGRLGEYGNLKRGQAHKMSGG